MEQISLPTKVMYKEGANPNEAIMTIEPLYPGYGLTIGNALRRALLSSLPGGAVTAVKIKGADHEFSTLPYVEEDVVDIILNIKKLRFAVHTDEEVRISLKAKGEKEVTGADIEVPASVEVATPNEVICHLTNKNAQIEMELFVKRGRGFIPTEARDKEKLELGTIMVDSIFTPIRKVGMQVEDMRVGQLTNYNRVVMTIETDGSMTAEEAVKEASTLLIEHLEILRDGGVKAEAPSKEEEEDMSEDKESVGVVIDDTIDMNQDGNTLEQLASDDEPKKKKGRPKRGE